MLPADSMLAMGSWPQLTAEQYAVMISAEEQAYLNSVIDEWHAREHWAALGTTTVGPPPLSDDAKGSLIGRFAGVVGELIRRGWIETRQPTDGVWAHAEPITPAEITSTLVDPDAWIWSADGNVRMVMLVTTSRWDALIATDHEDAHGDQGS